MPSDSQQPKLPSVNDLLQHPRVRGLLKRVNQSTVATRAADFFGDLRQNLRERANQIDLPSLSDLAEQFAGKLLGEAPDEQSVVNATGVVIGNSVGAPPLPECAISAMLATSGEYRRADHAQAMLAGKMLSEIAGCDSAMAVSTFSAACWLTVGTFAPQHELGMVSNHQSALLDWQRLAANAGAVWREGLSPDDTEAISQCQVLLHDGGILNAKAATDRIAKLRERSPQAMLVDLAPWAGPLDPNTIAFPSVPNWSDRLSAGADLVLADGHGLLGGPSSGLLLGRKAAVERIAANPLAKAVAIDDLVAKALTATARCYRAPEEVRFTVPTWQLLSTPIANLQQRAERIARLASASPTVRRAEAVPSESPWLADSREALSASTWFVLIEPEGQSTEHLSQRLAGFHPAVSCRTSESQLEIDLRSVFPRWDQSLVAALTG